MEDHVSPVIRPGGKVWIGKAGSEILGQHADGTPVVGTVNGVETMQFIGTVAASTPIWDEEFAARWEDLHQQHDPDDDEDTAA